MAKEQLKMMVMQAGLGMPPSEVVSYIDAVVEVIVQLKRGEKGVRFISEIYFKHKQKFDKLKQEGKLPPVNLQELIEPYKNKVSVDIDFGCFAK